MYIYIYILGDIISMDTKETPQEIPCVVDTTFEYGKYKYKNINYQWWNDV